MYDAYKLKGKIFQKIEKVEYPNLIKKFSSPSLLSITDILSRTLCKPSPYMHPFFRSFLVFGS